MYKKTLVLGAVFLPGLTSLAIYVIKNKTAALNFMKLLVVAAILIPFISTLVLHPSVIHQDIISLSCNVLLPLGITFHVDELSLFMSEITLILWLLAAVFSFNYMAGKHSIKRYYAFLLASLSGCVGVAFAGNLLTLFLFFEIASLVPYALIIHSEKPYAIRASNKYLYMSLAGGLTLFFSIVYTYFLTGTTDFIELKVLAKQGSFLPLPVFMGFLLGFGIKGGIFPLHIWLPDAHPVAPSPISSLLSGITIKVGLYGIFRLVFSIYDFNVLNQAGLGTLIRVLAAITILLGSAMALSQKNLKKLLAYSSISQMGYILLGIGLLTERAVFGAVFHLFSHAFMKGTLFLCAGAIKHKTGKTDVDNMEGVGLEMPFTMIFFTIAALSMIGIPPMSGFLSKWYLGLGSLDAGMPVYLIILLVSSLMNAMYFLPIIISAFFKKGSSKKIVLKEAPTLMLFSMACLTAGTVLGGSFKHHLFNLAQAAVKRLFI